MGDPASTGENGPASSVTTPPRSVRRCTTCGYEVDEQTVICPECGKNPAWCVCSVRFPWVSLGVFAVCVLSAGIVVGTSFRAIFFPRPHHTGDLLAGGIAVLSLVINGLFSWGAVKPLVVRRGVELKPPSDWFLIPPVFLLGLSLWFAAAWTG